MKVEEVVLKEKSWEYKEGDSVANQIKKLFGNPRNLTITIYSNDEWSFYKYNCCSIIREEFPLLWMSGSCLVKNSTKECCTYVSEIEDGLYHAYLSSDEAICFKLELLPKEKIELPRFI